MEGKQMRKLAGAGMFYAGAGWCAAAFAAMAVAYIARFFGAWGALLDMIGGNLSPETQLMFWGHPSYEAIGFASALAMLPGIGLIWLGDKWRK